MPDVPPTIVDLVETFDRNIEAYTNQSYNEAQVRREFIDPFFEALGWDIANKQGLAPAYKDVIHEDAIKVGGATKAPDYCFRIGGTRKFFLEAKKPSLDIKGDPHPAYQLRRYAWSAKLPLSVLTDFEEFAVYDCQIRPKQTDKADAARIKYYTYKQYLDNWHDIETIFSKDAILKGSFDKFAASAKGKRGTSTVDAEFLAEIEKWRQMLARSIALRNPDLTRDQLNFAVQRTIDRILFLRMCEDRGIETYSQLLALSTGRESYPRLCQLFRQADDKYNSGLFHFRREKARPDPDELTPNIKVDDKDLQWILHSLYYPQCPYEFSVLPAEILGNVYEQFLGKVIRLTAGHRAVVEEKPEVKKAGGVYYTPAYIVDYIVKNTVGKLLGIDDQLLAPGTCPPSVWRTAGGPRGPENPKPLSPKQISSLRILDPACGSGSFLLGAYTFLLDYHRDWYVAHDPKKHTDKIYQGRAGHYFLTIKEKKRILLNNIFGVDIDPQAVEVTKLALLLKVLEGENAETIGQVYRMFHERALPDLADNIKCGNSLIGLDFFDSLAPGPVPGDTDQLHKKINPFDWKAEFPQIFSGQNPGFNAIIGNPPYLFITEQQQPQKTYYALSYSTYSYRYDLYGLFIEKAFATLLARNGLLGFITPHTLLNNDSFQSLRNLLLQRTSLQSIIDLGPGVFQGAKNETMLLFSANTAPDADHRCFLVKSNSALANLDKLSPLRQDAFLRLPKSAILPNLTSSHLSLLDKLRSNEFTLGHCCTINQGLRTGDNARYLSQFKTIASHKPVVGGKNIARYLVRNHLFVQYEPDKLDAPRKESIFTSPQKLIVQEIRNITLARRIVAAFDDQQLYCLQSTNVINPKPSPKSHLDLRYLLGLLNSGLLNWFFRISFPSNNHIASNQLMQLPIRTIDFAAPDDVALHDKMVALVERMLDLHKKLAAAKIPTEKTQIQRQIKNTDDQIDSLVYKLYNLTPQEIKIIEEANTEAHK